MSRTRFLIAALAAGAIALAPSLGFARAGGGASMGSRGGMTFSPPPMTRTAPTMAAPMERSITPQAAPRPYGAPYSPAPSYSRGSPFMSGLMGGLIGAGIGGMLFGNGMFGGISGIGGFLGFLLQMFLVIWLVRLAWRFFANRQPSNGQPAMAGPSIFQRTTNGAGPLPGPRPMPGGGAAPPPVNVTKADFDAFETLLKQVQSAWSEHDIGRLQAISTPEMVSYFGEQLAEQTSRGVTNRVTDVKLEQGDLAQSWSERGREYATVAMRFSMNDVTTDRMGRVVDGDPSLRTMATEIWTFVRAPGGSWLLSAIQQTR